MWSSVIPFVAVTLALIFLPGTLVNLTAGLRPLSAVGFAPLVSTGVVAVAAIIWQLVGVPWGPLPIVLTTALTVGLAFAVRYLFKRFGWEPPLPEGAVRPGGVHPGWVLGGWATSIALLGRDVIQILGSPLNFSQTFDNIFHLNAVRWITENRMGSALDMRMTSAPEPSGFYPTAWHDLASGTLLTMGTVDPVRAQNALILVVTAVVWPLSCLLLTRRLLVPSRLNQLATGILSAAFTAFPFLLISFGVLYPNLLGLCLLPAMMAVAVDLLDIGDAPRSGPLGATWLLAAIGMVAIGLAHPNVALVLLDVVGVIMIVYWAVPTVWRAARQRDWTRQAKFRGIVLLGWLAGAALALKVIRPPISAGRWPNPRNLFDTLVETVSLSPMEATVVLVPAGLTWLGVLAAIIRRKYLLPVLLHAGMTFLWFVAGAVPMGFFRDLIVGSWYSDPYRLAVLLPITAVPLAVIGFDFAFELVAKRAPVLRSIPLLLAAALALTASIQFDPGRQGTIEWSAEHYRIRLDSNLVDSYEYRLIQRLPEIVPAGEVIAVNPWNGSSMAYALVGVQTTHTHVLFDETADEKTIREYLNQAENRPAVCSALAAEDVKWVLDFGNTRLVNGIIEPYRGFFFLQWTDGFEPVASEGPAVLYRITACD